MVYFTLPLNCDSNYPNFVECKLYYLGVLQVTCYIKNSKQAVKRFENTICRYMYFKDDRKKVAYDLDYSEMKGYHSDTKPKSIFHTLPRCK